MNLFMLSFYINKPLSGALEGLCSSVANDD